MEKLAKFWNGLSEFQRAMVRKELKDGVISPLVENNKGENAYIDYIEVDENGKEIIYGQVS
jgi:hypothetical protein